jgi:hypothetical protein
MEWPLKDETTGKFRSTPTNQSIWLEAARAAEDIAAASAFADRIQNCKNWRSDYTDILEDFAKLMLAASPANAIQMCQAGLDAAEQAFVFRMSDDDGDDDNTTTVPLKEAMTRDCKSLEDSASQIYKGKQPVVPTPFKLASPNGSDSNPLFVTGEDAVQQIQTWSDYGCMEPSAVEHAAATCLLPDVSALTSNKTFCLLGLTSEMGPAYSLLRIPGAHVMGVARSAVKVAKLVEWLEHEGAETTTLETLQADMLKETPQIAKRIIETAPRDRELIILPLAYMDGEACVRVTVAMDAIVTSVMKHRDDIGLCYYISPAIVFPIPAEAARDAKQRYENEKDTSWKRWLSTVSMNKWYQPANTWKQLNDGDPSSSSLPVLNGLVNFQGPNYALAKTMQTWRCMVAHASGANVSAPPAPGTRTDSVLHSSEAATFVEGLQYVSPMLVFDVWPCSSLLTAIVLHQLDQHNNNSNNRQELQHPLTMFWDGAVHGGAWRCPYASESFMTMSYILGKTIAKKGWCPTEALAPKPEASSNDNNV